MTAPLVMFSLMAIAFTPGQALSQSCPGYLPFPAGESLDYIGVTKPSNNNCSVADGSYVLKGSVLRLDASGTAYGWCERWWPIPTCHQIATYPRKLGDIDAWNNKGGTPYSYYSTAYGKTESGSCAVGAAHAIDTRNYSPTSCGRFGLYTAGYDGEHTITAEGDILPTPCNMAPLNTPQRTISFHARCALSRGSSCGPTSVGSLVGDGAPPNGVDGLGYEHYHGNEPSPDPYDIQGSCNWMHSLIYIAGAGYQANHPGEALNYGDMSKPGGGYWSDHPGGCHQNGLHVDIRYPNVNGTTGPLNLADAGDRALFDRARFVDMVNALTCASAGGPIATRIVDGLIVSPYVDPPISAQDMICDVPITVDNTPPQSHDDHFHVSLADEDGADGPCY